MQACLENTSLPLLEPGSLPLLESVPAWTVRIARPIAPNREEFAQELLGVPKAALRRVFGKVLGTHLWLQNRAASTAAKAAPPESPSLPARISDGEISVGLLRYLCAEAAATLRERQRLAKSIALAVSYSDGQTETVRQPLARAANDATSLETAARLALRNARWDAFVSLKLDVTTILVPTSPQNTAETTQAPLTRVA